MQNNIVPSKVIQVDNLNVKVDTNKNEARQVVDGNIDFSKIKTQDVMLIEYESTKRGNEKYEMVHENFELERNIPEYDTYSNIKMNDKFVTNIHKDVELGRNLPEYNIYSNKNDVDRSLGIEYDIQLERNLPEYQIKTVKTNNTNSKISYIHDDVVLSRNVPEYETYSQKSGNEKIEYIHSDIELHRVLPEHEATTNISQNMRKTLLHNKMKDYERKAILSTMSTNDSRKGEINMNNATNYSLQDKIQPGEFVNAGFVPLVERTQGMGNIRMVDNNRKLRIKRD